MTKILKINSCFECLFFINKDCKVIGKELSDSLSIPLNCPLEDDKEEITIFKRNQSIDFFKKDEKIGDDKCQNCEKDKDKFITNCNCKQKNSIKEELPIFDKIKDLVYKYCNYNNLYNTEIYIYLKEDHYKELLNYLRNFTGISEGKFEKFTIMSIVVNFYNLDFKSSFSYFCNKKGLTQTMVEFEEYIENFK
jgi:hypothetical protein